MTHDVNYLLATGQPRLYDDADNLAISKTDFSIKSAFMHLGLDIRKMLHIKENEGIDNVEISRRDGYDLRNIILYSKEYEQVRNTYNINQSYFIK